ncbi:hypothetical protein N9E25_15815 [Verrucomicrobiales bacterium]|nr:hypothetical protein [Verrucomicrobiales bacterium]
MSEFLETEPTPENCWRSIILFGRNVASYKFALGKALLGMGRRPGDLVKLDELADPFSRHLREHLRLADKQATSSSSRFLEACRRANRGEIPEDQLRDTTVKLGFANVIDAFHVVNDGDVPARFFIDERRESAGIRLTEEFFRLATSNTAVDLEHEIEARWRLVETAWDLGLSRGLISSVTFDEEIEGLFIPASNRRIDVTSCRDALNGYQKGRCFYCFTPIDLEPGSIFFADVDHFFPKALGGRGIVEPVDGVWNLVLACRDCNRGEGGKSARVPTIHLLDRLSRRNEYFISSHHPLRETLMAQTGSTPVRRKAFLQSSHTGAITTLIHSWEPEPRGPSNF